MSDPTGVPVGATLGGTASDHRRLAQLAARPDDPRVRAHLASALWLGRLDDHRGHRDLPDVIAAIRAAADCDVQLLAEQRPLPTVGRLAADLETLTSRAGRACDRPVVDAIVRDYLAQRADHHVGHLEAWEHAVDMFGLDEVEATGRRFGHTVDAAVAAAWRRTVPAVAWGRARRQLLFARNVIALADGALLAGDVPAAASCEPTFAATLVCRADVVRLADASREAALLASLLDVDGDGDGGVAFDEAAHICRQLAALR